MKRFLICSVLGFGAWLTFSTAWAVAGRLTPVPGPARTASASVDAVSRVMRSVELPAPLAAPQQLLTSQLRASGRVVERLYAVPERLAGRFVHGLPTRMQYAGLFKQGEPCRTPLVTSAGSEFDEGVQIRLDGQLWNLQTRLERLQVDLEGRRVRAKARHARAESRKARAAARRIHVLQERLHASTGANGIVIRIVK